MGDVSLANQTKELTVVGRKPFMDSWGDAALRIGSMADVVVGIESKATGG